MSIQLRQQQIIKILQDEGSKNVNELAKRLSVTGATIRSDLRKLEHEGILRRYHGGAMLTKEALGEDSLVESRKKSISRYAATFLQDGDSVLFDASTTVKYMTQSMQHLRDLTLFTNGIDMAQELVKNSSSQVILIGGRLQTDGDMVKGIRGFSIMEGLNISKTFISCSGFSLRNGLTTFDVDEAAVMRERISIAQQVIALVDSTKFGKEGVAPFADLHEISVIITDEGISPQWIQQVRAAGLELAVVDDEGEVKHYSARREKLKIGFANLDTTSSFASDVQSGLEAAAANAGFQLLVKNNQLNSELALENANELIEEGIDLMIEYHIDEHIGAVIMDKFIRRHIPVIAVDIPLVGATYFGVDNYNAGMMAGQNLGDWIMSKWHGHYDLVLILEEPRGGTLPAARTYGQIDGLQKVLGKIPERKRMRLNSGNRIETSRDSVKKALQIYPEYHRFALLGFNDDSAMGALLAARDLGREKDVVIVGLGVAPVIREELRDPDSRVMGSTAFWPEQYGEHVIKLAKRIIEGDRVPNAVTMKHTFITCDNIDEYYPKNGK